MDYIDPKLCDAKTAIIQSKLDNIHSSLLEVKADVAKVIDVTNTIVNHERRLAILEKWKESLSLNKVIISVAATITALGIIYTAIQQLFFR